MLLLFIKHCCCTAKGTNGNCERLESMWTYRKPTKNHWATQCIGKRGRKYIQVSIWSRVIKCSSVRWWSSNQLNMLQTEASQNTRTLNQQPVEHITVALLPKQITIHIYMEVWWSQWVMKWWWRYLSTARCSLQMVQLMPLQPKTSSSLASFKSRLFYLSGTGLPRLSWRRGR